MLKTQLKPRPDMAPKSSPVFCVLLFFLIQFQLASTFSPYSTQISSQIPKIRPSTPSSHNDVVAFSLKAGVMDYEAPIKRKQKVLKEPKIWEYNL